MKQKCMFDDVDDKKDKKTTHDGNNSKNVVKLCFYLNFLCVFYL